MSEPSRIAVVTGGTSGIGLATARKLLTAGHRVAVFSHSADTVAEASASLSAEFEPGRVLGRIVDLANPTAITRFFDELQSIWGIADILVCNAGISPKGPNGPRRFEDMGLDEWNEVLAVNLTGAMLCCQAVVSGMRQAGFGRIVLVGSLAGRTRPHVGGPAYAASKAGLAGLMRTLVGPFSPFGITVNLVAPGRILTPLTGDPIHRPTEKLSGAFRPPGLERPRRSLPSSHFWRHRMRASSMGRSSMSTAVNMHLPRATAPCGALSRKGSEGMSDMNLAERNRGLIWTADAELFLPFSYILKTEGFVPSLACSADDVLDSCANDVTHAILLDCTHETQDAVSLCLEVRRSACGKEVRLIALLREGAQPLHLALLRAGVDDCLVRPLSPEKLLMSLRQAGSGKVKISDREMTATPAGVGFEIDTEGRRVRCNGQNVVLSPIEIKILSYLVERAGQLCSRSELIASAWPPATRVTPRTVDVHIGRLRKALKRMSACEAIIRTVYTSGDVFDPPGLAHI
jgi:NAD(P)-dependent dehydrogenase (short-subunit alcohol dehydrogenase family)/DNA-binding response OmpR family regulator